MSSKTIEFVGQIQHSYTFNYGERQANAKPKIELDLLWLSFLLCSSRSQARESGDELKVELGSSGSTQAWALVHFPSNCICWYVHELSQ